MLLSIQHCYRWVCIEKETLEIDCFLYMVVFRLVSYASCKPAACIPAINGPQVILILLEGHYCLHEDHHPVQSTAVFIYFVLLTISPQHPKYPDFQVSLISQPSSIPFSSSLWLLFLSS
ncbi:Uncharacterized protein APZ42_028719 [Daphnia magna]|uniref:Uncharacterized protein n=1 Tax=Daphnia magna TaxID=35525 RepID=A0A164QAX6_9CRUS|nr:Uncharacterized protein APZ42_028719 [Daphnia magna]